jgi:hypothetical protein
MNEKLQYRAMLGIPEYTSSITVKPEKKKKVKKKIFKAEDVKEKVIEKVNDATKNENKPVSTDNNQNPPTEAVVDNANTTNNVKTEVETVVEETTETTETAGVDTNVVNEESTATVKIVKNQTPKNKPKRLTLVKVQVAIIGILLAVILLTSAINQNSGINVFMRSVFAPSEVDTVDGRLYTEFAPVFSTEQNQISLDENGVITTTKTGSIYSSVKGTLESAVLTDAGTYSVIVKHSENFSSKIDGLKYVYLSVGDVVNTTIPLGYAEEQGVSLCFMGENDEVITDYTIKDGTVVWAV